jgi:hypothetical protein
VADIYKHGRKILRTVLETNAVAFTQDRATNQWMAGYYNNNAILRLSDLLSDPVARAVIVDAIPANLEATPLGWYRPDRQDEFSNLTPIKQWEIACEAFKMTFQLLEKVHERGK